MDDRNDATNSGHDGELTSRDLEGFHAGTETHCWRVLGAHLVTIPDEARGEVHGARFSVWAPNARAVRVKGDFDAWTGVALAPVPGTGVWALFVEGVRKVVLEDWVDIVATREQAPFCTAVTITRGAE